MIFSDFIIWDANENPGIVYFDKQHFVPLKVSDGRYLAFEHTGFEMTTNYTPIFKLEDEDDWGSGLLKNWKNVDEKSIDKSWFRLEIDIRGSDFIDKFTKLVFWLFDNGKHDFTVDEGHRSTTVFFSNEEDAMAFKLAWL